MATIRFLADWSHVVEGTIEPGNMIVVYYAPERARLRPIFRGSEAWDFRGTGHFLPGGEIESGYVVRYTSSDEQLNWSENEGSLQQTSRRSSPHPPGFSHSPVAVPWKLKVPAEASHVEMWFENTDVYRSSWWDSRYGQNYRFEVTDG
jgi:hypothetical protein